MITNQTVRTDRKVRAMVLQNREQLEELVKTYEFDRIVYFSEYSVPHSAREGELDRLHQLLQANKKRNVQLLYLAGPESVLEPPTGRTMLAQSAERLCNYYAQNSDIQIKILRLPYLYGMDDTQGGNTFSALFSQPQQGYIHTDKQAAQPLLALCMDDLAELVARIFDSWTPEPETFTVPTASAGIWQQAGERLQQLSPGLRVEYGTDVLRQYPPDDGVLRRRFGWFPRFSLLEDLPALWQNWQAAQIAREKPAHPFWARIRSKKRLLTVLEILAAWLAAEVLVRASAVQAQFRMLDFRLLFVVLSGTLYGMNEGVLAAALAAVSLVLGYMRQGTAPVLLFYEPSYWLAFLAYFLAGSVCGYVQMHNTETNRFVQEESQLVQQRMKFVQQLYQDALEEKRLLRQQILGRKDSYGKLYAVTKRLDVLQPQEVCRRALQVLEEVLETQSLAFYRVDDTGCTALLEAASPAWAERAPHSFRLEAYEKVLHGMEQDGVWVNRSLQAELPFYAAAMRRNGTIKVLLVQFDAQESDFTLYYQNLFYIFSGLVETALNRAFAYEAATARERYLSGTRVLRKTYFAQRLAAACALQEEKRARYLLLRLSGSFQTGVQLWERLQHLIREGDAVGIAADDSFCLLLGQADEWTLPEITRRLAAKGISAQPVPWEVQRRLAGGKPEVTV